MQSSVITPEQTLSEELKAARHLVDLLKQEQAFLIDANIDSLATLTEKKTAVVARMSELANARHKHLSAAGVPASEAGMQQWINSLPASSTAIRLWADLLALVRSAREMNRTNGLLISTQMGRNQTALNVLQNNAQGGSSFYGPDGQSTAKAVGRGLVVG